MRHLALHWQILIGMIAGSLLGIGLNLFFGSRDVTVTQGLPADIVSAHLIDTSARTEIRYVKSTGEEVLRIVDPLSKQKDEARSVDALKPLDAVAYEVYQAHGVSPAKQIGLWCKRLGGLFLRMLQMVAVPLIITSLTTGILGLGGGKGVGRMFRRTLVYYLITSLLAIVTGLLMVNLIRPGLGTGAPPTDVGLVNTQAKSLGDVMFSQIEALIPSNPLAALVAPDFLSIIAFTIAFSLFTMRVGGTVLEHVRTTAQVGFQVVMAMTTAIIHLAPLGVFFLITYVTATQGAGVFKALGWYVLAVTIGLVIHGCITLPLIVKIYGRRSPIEFAKAMSPALITAFSSASSNGTLPLTMSSVETRAGISNRTGSFVLPLGATINMDGTALYEAVAVMFIAQMHHGENLPLAQQIIVAFTALLASVGAAGIPHAGLVMMVIILQAVNLPVELQGVILAVDRVLDMARTTVNVWSDACGCAVVEYMETRDSAAVVNAME